MPEKAHPESSGRNLTTAAMIMAICLVSFSIFRGAANILNALVIPLALAIGKQKLAARFFAAVALALAGLTAILFPMQLVFVVFYCGLAILIQIFLRLRHLALAILLHTVAVSISFWLAIMLTDWLFLTEMQPIMLALLNNNYLIYAAMILFEGLIVGSSQIFLARLFRKRLLLD